ncbi:hypothetical protein SAY86_016720 [Trapa natans]|uniref:BHLH domain-containing protein n=1 Tax=Trapa natans TaxID=22666 RepID=A0AAN7LGJ5_TRANT|nr:hypothetical protein SAY86_016720 [Trapa natans]
MDADHLKSAQGSDLEMLMMLPTMEQMLLPDYFAGAAEDGQASGFPHCYPENPHLASPSRHGKSPLILFTTSSGGSGYATESELDDVNCSGGGGQGPHTAAPNSNMEAMREMVFRIAAMQPINIDPEMVRPPKRRNVRISSDPQSVAARHRRERISERIRILQMLVPGGTKMDTASMLDEAIHYVKFLKRQVQSLERVATSYPTNGSGGGSVALKLGFPVAAADHHNNSYSVNPAIPYHHHHHQYYHNYHHVATAGTRAEHSYGGF